MPGERDGVPGPAQRAAELEAPILALQAGDDQHISAEMNEAFDRALTGAGSSTSSSPTTERRTASSIVVTRSSRTRPMMPGAASSGF
jgi:hypothetical protein